MGYPTKRVSMTDVHGEPQQGGYLPAEIWHAYMSQVVEGTTCEQFAAAQESLSYEPFYGKFATTGQSRSAPEEAGEASNERKSHTPEKHAPGKGGTGTPSPAPPAHEEPTVSGTGGASPGH
jgi:membrane peptidoglycan carboxypeptidase